MHMTTIFDPTTDPALSALGFLEYVQLPTIPAFPSEFSLSADVYTPIPSLLDLGGPGAFGPAGVTLDTDGTPFNGIPGFSVTDFIAENFSNPSGTLTAGPNTGYAGFTNYTIEGEITEAQVALIALGLLDVEDLFTLEQTREDFPELDPAEGFTLSFDLTIAEESSAVDRAGFSLLVVTNDPSQEIEIGFKTDGSDRVFAQAANFGEAETSSSPLDFSVTATYALTVTDSGYSLAVGDNEILSGDLRNYNFDPATSDPPLPESANPYEIPNLVFFGDNTDQAHATFTLGNVTISPIEVDPVPDTPSDERFFSYAQSVRLRNPSTAVPVDAIDGLTLAQLFDEQAYLDQNVDVASAIRGGAFASGYDHFRQFGLREGRNPSALYDEAFYLNSHQLVADAVANGQFSSGLEHFLLFGNREGRDPSQVFDQSDYLANNPTVGTAVSNGSFSSAFEHYIEFGINEGRIPALAIFNEGFYLSQNADVAGAVRPGGFADGFDHFARFGQREGRQPSTLFNEGSYLSRYSDVAAAVDQGSFISGFEHYALFGRFEGRQAIDAAA